MVLSNLRTFVVGQETSFTLPGEVLAYLRAEVTRKTQYRRQLKEIEKEWENREFQAISQSELETTLRKFGMTFSRQKKIQKLMTENCEYGKAVEQFAVEGGSGSLVTFTNDTGKKVMFASQAVFIIFRTIVCGINWKRNECKEHPNCMLEFQKKVLLCMEKYADFEGKMYLVEDVDEDIAKLQSMCYQQFTQKKRFAWDPSDLHASYKEIANHFSLPEFSLDLSRGENMPMRINIVKMHLHMGWMMVFFDHYTSSLAVFIFDAMALTLDKPYFAREYYFWNKVRTDQEAEKKRLMKQKMEEQRVDMERSAREVKEIRDREKSKQSDEAIDSLASGVEATCIEPACDSFVASEPGKSTKSDRCKSCFENNRNLTEAQEQVKRCQKMAADCMKLSEQCEAIQADLAGKQEKYEAAVKFLNQETKSKEEALEENDQHADIAREYEKKFKDLKMMIRDMAKLKEKYEEESADLEKRANKQKKLLSREGVVNKLRVSAEEIAQKNEAAKKANEALKDQIEAKQLQVAIDESNVEQRQIEHANAEKERLTKLVTDMDKHLTERRQQNHSFYQDMCAQIRAQEEEIDEFLEDRIMALQAERLRLAAENNRLVSASTWVPSAPAPARLVPQQPQYNEPTVAVESVNISCPTCRRDPVVGERVMRCTGCPRVCHFFCSRTWDNGIAFCSVCEADLYAPEIFERFPELHSN